MKRFSQILLTSALALAVLAPALADAAPKKKCAIEDKEVFYLMLSVDNTVSDMQYDLLNYGYDKDLKNAMDSVRNAVKKLHQDFGQRAVKHDDVYYENELDALKKAASNYYRLAYDRMDSQQIQNAYELSWLLQEGEKTFEQQCKTPGRKDNKWSSRWENRPKFPVDNNRKPGNAHHDNGHPGMNAPHPNGHPGVNAPHPNGHPGMNGPRPVVKTPVDENTFLAIRKQLRSCSFQSDLVKMLESIAPYNYFTMSQLQTLLKDQTSDDKRLAVLEHVFPRLLDKNNWFMLYDFFTFQSSKDKVKSIAEANL